MKKLTIILLLIPICLNAQMRLEEDYSFKTDKQYHASAGILISTGMFAFVNNKTNDVNLAFNAAWMSGTTAGLLKEGFDLMSGREISTADFGYTAIGALANALLLRQITKHRNKKKAKKDKILRLALTIN